MIVKRAEYERLKALESDYNNVVLKNKVLNSKLKQKAVEHNAEVIEHSKTRTKLGKAIELLEKNHIQHTINYKK